MTARRGGTGSTAIEATGRTGAGGGGIRRPGPGRWRLALPALLAIPFFVAACGSGQATGPTQQYTSARAVTKALRPQRRPAVTPAGSELSGTLYSSGGPFLRDRYGRVVFLHGVDAVYKRPPFELYADPGKPWNFNAQDAREIASLGFNVVRLGILWEGLEPGAGGPNQPSICTPGAPRPVSDLHMFNKAVAHAYLAKVAHTVDLLGRYHIYTLLDMHQDVLSQPFRGEGAPEWAVCTDDDPIVPLDGRWSRNYSNPTLDIAIQHFWSNDVVGNLQGQYDLVWHTVASYFKDNPWVVGYDPFNEPFSKENTPDDTLAFASTPEPRTSARSSSATSRSPARRPTRAMGWSPPSSRPTRTIWCSSSRTSTAFAMASRTCSVRCPFPTWSSTSTSTAATAAR
jgi:hypothetical protein